MRLKFSKENEALLVAIPLVCGIGIGYLCFLQCWIVPNSVAETLFAQSLHLPYTAAIFYPLHHILYTVAFQLALSPANMLTAACATSAVITTTALLFIFLATYHFWRIRLETVNASWCLLASSITTLSLALAPPMVNVATSVSALPTTILLCAITLERTLAFLQTPTRHGTLMIVFFIMGLSTVGSPIGVIIAISILPILLTTLTRAAVEHEIRLYLRDIAMLFLGIFTAVALLAIIYTLNDMLDSLVAVREAGTRWLAQFSHECRELVATALSNDTLILPYAFIPLIIIALSIRRGNKAYLVTHVARMILLCAVSAWFIATPVVFLESLHSEASATLNIFLSFMWAFAAGTTCVAGLVKNDNTQNTTRHRTTTTHTAQATTVLVLFALAYASLRLSENWNDRATGKIFDQIVNKAFDHLGPVNIIVTDPATVRHHAIRAKLREESILFIPLVLQEKRTIMAQAASKYTASDNQWISSGKAKQWDLIEENTRDAFINGKFAQMSVATWRNPQFLNSLGVTPAPRGLFYVAEHYAANTPQGLFDLNDACWRAIEEALDTPMPAMFASAADTLRQTLARVQNDAAVLMAMEGDPQKADATWQRALKNNPNNISALLNLYATRLAIRGDTTMTHNNILKLIKDPFFSDSLEINFLRDGFLLSQNADELWLRVTHDFNNSLPLMLPHLLNRWLSFAQNNVLPSPTPPTILPSQQRLSDAALDAIVTLIKQGSYNEAFRRLYVRWYNKANVSMDELAMMGELLLANGERSAVLGSLFTRMQHRLCQEPDSEDRILLIQGMYDRTAKPPALERAANAFRRVLKINPHDTRAAYELMLTDKAMDDDNTTIQDAHMILASQPTCILAHAALGEVYFRKNNITKARYHFENSLKDNCATAETERIYAQTLLADGDTETAKLFACRAIRRAPTQEANWQTLAHIQDIIGEPSTTTKIIAKQFRKSPNSRIYTLDLPTHR